MPGPTEYHHLVQIALDDQGLRCQTLDMDGRRCESVAWPLAPGASRAWRFKAGEIAPGPARVLLEGWCDAEPFPRVRISLDGWTPRLTVALYNPRETYPCIWTGPDVPIDRPLDVTVAVDPDWDPAVCWPVWATGLSRRCGPMQPQGTPPTVGRTGGPVGIRLR